MGKDCIVLCEDSVYFIGDVKVRCISEVVMLPCVFQ